MADNDSNLDNTVLGNQFSYFNGELITSKDGYTRIASIVFLLVPYLLFGTTTLPWFLEVKGWSLPVLIIVLCILSLSLFFATSLSDPGIIPRQANPYEICDPIRRNKRYSTILPQIEISVNGKFLKIKYCHTCNIYRNPRSVHCSVCNVCVDRFDHHCKWLGNCVGLHNYKKFIAFIVITLVLLIILVTLSIFRIVSISGGNNLAGIIESGSLIVYILFTGWFIVGLAIYHLYLISTNQTTNEQLKSAYSNYNPWNRGFIRNVIEILFKVRTTKHYYLPTLQLKTIYNPVVNVEDVVKNNVKCNKVNAIIDQQYIKECSNHIFSPLDNLPSLNHTSALNNTTVGVRDNIPSLNRRNGIDYSNNEKFIASSLNKKSYWTCDSST